jgi:hypothetical protein
MKRFGDEQTSRTKRINNGGVIEDEFIAMFESVTIDFPEQIVEQGEIPVSQPKIVKDDVYHAVTSQNPKIIIQWRILRLE